MAGLILKPALVAGAGVVVLLLAAPRLPAPGYTPAALGAAAVLLTLATLLRHFPQRERLTIAAIAAALGFFAGAAATMGELAWPLGFAAAWLPAVLLLLAGSGREGLAYELERLEAEADAPAARSRVIARAGTIRDKARAAARALDPDAARPPEHPGDPRGVYAYAAQVAGYALALEGRFEEAAQSLADVPQAWMPAPMRPLMLSNLSHWLLCAGDIGGAGLALEGAPEKEASEEVRPVLRAARAAVLVRAGEIDEALDLVGLEDGERGEPPLVRQRYRVTRAHALAAKGEVEAARAELERVLEDAGVEELRRWLPAGGPGAALMEELAGGKKEETVEEEAAGEDA
jgi:hypothetical protein